MEPTPTSVSPARAELSEENLEEALNKVKNYLVDRSAVITVKPTKFLFRPEYFK
jgi:hypothetical protein